MTQAFWLMLAISCCFGVAICLLSLLLDKFDRMDGRPGFITQPSDEEPAPQNDCMAYPGIYDAPTAASLALCREPEGHDGPHVGSITWGEAA